MTHSSRIVGHSESASGTGILAGSPVIGFVGGGKT
jgi:hypothetical protein